MLLLALCINCCLAASAVCGKQHSEKFMNTVDPTTLMYPDSFSKGTDPCEITTNAQYRKLFNIDQTYQVEHIVDQSNAPFNECNKNIIGNLAIADASWNQGVGSLCWENVYNEKVAVYGQKTVDTAIYNVEKCCKGITRYETAWIALGAFVGIVVIVGIVVWLCQVRRHRDSSW